ncbi:Uncharacterised protein [Bordetella pertussis]|nr:Uncharacterised protein [Bordetella pertussis]CFO67438.1 Uncharacterised protein [Bordetella pertussis]CFP63213.1 Uncharacterised protein [Bordetella pertussis]CFU81192.1 Uncharacterised protein [Bordetella pertussis]CFW35878.1 Uncharacterised protein [Bordetella pertussis]
MSEPGVRLRFHEKITSSAVNGEPSWNLTPLRSLNTHLVGSVFSQLSASSGTSFSSPS